MDIHAKHEVHNYYILKKMKNKTLKIIEKKEQK